ncbi:MAG: hypothetical protein ACI31G_00155 [Bacilli bacterium]
MNKKELRTEANKLYKKHPLIRFFLSFMFGLFLTAVITLFVILDNFGYLSLLLIPILVLPFLFAIITIQNSIDDVPYINFRLFFSHFTLYFNRKYRSSFRFLNSLMYSLLFMLAGELVFSIVAFGIVSLIDAQTLMEAISKIQYAIYDGSIATFSSIEELLADAHAFNLFQIFSAISSIPPLVISIVVFIFLISKNSFSIYLKKGAKNVDPYHINNLLKETLRGNKTFYKNYFYLNWPLYFLLIVGTILGAFIGSIFTLDTVRLTIIALSSGFLLMSFYLPIYFSNNEVLFLNHLPEFEKSKVVLAKKIVEQMQRNIQFNEQEKELLEKKMKEFEERQKQLFDDEVKDDDSQDDESNDNK